MNVVRDILTQLKTQSSNLTSEETAVSDTNKSAKNASEPTTGSTSVIAEPTPVGRHGQEARANAPECPGEGGLEASVEDRGDVWFHCVFMPEWRAKMSDWRLRGEGRGNGSMHATWRRRRRK